MQQSDLGLILAEYIHLHNTEMELLVASSCSSDTCLLNLVNVNIWQDYFLIN